MSVRLPYIDFAKTFGIALVVLGHISGQGEGVVLTGIRDFIYQFHIPLFFFLSGYCFKEYEEWKPFLIKKFRRLYLPFVLWNLVFLVIHVVAHHFAGETASALNTFKHSLKILLGIAVTPLGGATWFLITLLQALILYKLVLSAFRSAGRFLKLYVLIIAFVPGILGTVFELPFRLEKAFVALAFVCFGHLTKQLSLLQRVNERFHLPLALVGMLAVFFISRFNHSDLAFHQDGIIPVFWLSALVGIFSVLFLCASISRGRVASFLSEWGQKTIWILIGHFAAFKLVTLIQMACFRLPGDTIFSHPCNQVGGAWALAYFAAGFFLPLLCSKLFRA